MILHFVEPFDGAQSIFHIRCDHCGDRLWVVGGHYTTNKELWDNLPKGYNRCVALMRPQGEPVTSGQ